MADFEIQVKASSFLAALKAGLEGQRLCPPPPLDFGATSVRIQRIEIGANSLRHNVPAFFAVAYEWGGKSFGVTVDGFKTQVVQNVVLHATTTEDVLAHPNGEPALDIEFPLRVVLDLEYFGADTYCVLHTTLGGLEWDNPPPLPTGVDLNRIKKTAEAAIEKTIPHYQAIAFAKLLPNTPMRIENAGMTFSSDLSVVALRAEVGPAGSGADIRWTNFFKGAIADRLEGADWGWFVPSNLLELTFATAVWHAADEEAARVPGLQIMNVGTKYSPDGNVAHLDTTINAILDLPALPAQTIHPTVRVDLSVPEVRRLALDMYLPSIHSIVEHMDFVAHFLLGFVLSPLVDGAETLLLAAVAKLPMPKDKAIQCSQVGPLHHRCTYALPSPEGAGTKLRLNRLSAQPDRVLLSGTVKTPSYTPSKLEVSFEGFRWTPPEISCASADIALAAAFASEAERLAPVSAKVVFNHSGTAPVYLCNAEVINDPLGKFPTSALSIDSYTLPSTITLEVANPGPQYAANPYPVDILVTTTLGARLVRIPPAPALTQADIDRLEALVIEEIGNCTLLTTPPGFNLKWLIDPAIFEIFLHSWEISFVGLLAGESLKLFDHAGKELAHASALEGAPTMLFALLAPAELEANELTLMRYRDGEPAPPAPDLGVEILQQVLQPAAVVTLDAPCRRLFASALRSQDEFVAVLTDGLAAFDASEPTRPNRTGRWRVEGMLGAWSWPEGVLVFSEHGFLNLDPQGRLSPIGSGEEPARILDAALGEGVAYVLTERALEVRSTQLKPWSSVPAAGARCLVRLGSRVIAGGPEGIAVHRLDEEGHISPDAVRSCPDLDVTGLEIETATGHPTILATLRNGSLRALALGEDDRAQPVARFPEVPWFAGAVALRGDALALIAANRRQVQVATRGESRRVGAEATSPLPSGPSRVG